MRPRMKEVRERARIILDRCCLKNFINVSNSSWFIV
jgi:hypothetical protein